MPKISTKHENQKIIDISDFYGGLNLMQGGEAIADNELQIANNIHYGIVKGHIGTVPGLVSSYNPNINVDTVFFLTTTTALFSSGSTLYFTDLTSHTSLGSLTGSSRPTYVWFGTDVMIASGGQLQKYASSTLSTVTSAPSVSSMLVRSGRLVVSWVGDDWLKYSAVGDCTSSTAWTDTPSDDSTAKSLRVGYKVKGTLTAICPIYDVIIAFKTGESGDFIYRISGDYASTSATWNVKEVAANTSCANQWSVVPAMGTIFFLCNKGFHAIVSSTVYGDFELKDIGSKINNKILRSLDVTQARVWYVKRLQQIWIMPNNLPIIYIYHIHRGVFTARTLADAPTDVTNYGNEIYVLKNKKILRVSNDLSTDDGTNIQQVIKTKTMIAKEKILIKKVVIRADNEIRGTAILSIGNLSINIDSGAGGDIAIYDHDIARDDSDPAWSAKSVTTVVRCNNVVDKLEAVINITSGQWFIRNMQVVYAEVG